MNLPSETRSERCLIRLLRAADAPLLQRYRVVNREHFAPWEPRRDDAYFTLEGCRRSIADATAAAADDRAYAFAALDPAGNDLLASFTLANVARGPFQACVLGYGVAAAIQGRGLMLEVLEVALALAFGPLGLHRVMANHLAHNERSARLLAGLGFEREGYARAYLKIDGRWQDHILTARIADAPSRHP